MLNLRQPKESPSDKGENQVQGRTLGDTSGVGYETMADGPAGGETEENKDKKTEEGERIQGN